MPGMKGDQFEGALVRLNVASRALAAEASRFSAPASVEQALIREMESLHAFRRRRIVYMAVGGAMAATLAVVAWMMQPRPVPKPAVVAHVAVDPEVVGAVVVPALQPVSSHRRRIVKAVAEPERPFIAIPYTLPLQPYERADVMRMDLPVSALIAAGLPMDMADPAALARADVLVGQDGRARAVRLISISNSN